MRAVTFDSEPAYRANLHFFRKLVGKNVELSVVVKSNAYGHGLLPVANLAVKHGADSFCVHSLDEALKLRRAGFQQDILIMGYISLVRLQEAVEGNFRIVVYNQETLERLNKAGQKLNRPARVHLKLETGTYRQGVDEKELPAFLNALKKSDGIKPEGIYTHFANIEDTTRHEYAYLQLNLFKKMVAVVRQAGFPDIKLHTACSAATLLFPETHFDMVRLGISQYGLWPSRETFLSYKIKHSKNDENVLQPVLTWKTRVAQVKTVPAKHTIGYGCTYQTTRDTRIAVLPVGYADGYDRRLSNQAHVLIRGRRAPVRGRVCMNLTMVNITDIPGVSLEDEVVLLGKQGSEEITAEYLAGLAGTINYEFVTRINWEIERVVV
ncbi:MAG: alanine racemase [Calditrichia bacterium]